MSSRHPDDGLLAPALVRAWRDDVPTDTELQRAYLRFLQRRPLRGPRQAVQVAVWVLVGMLLGMGSLYAASAARWRIFQFNTAQVAPPVAPTPAAAERPSRAPLPKLAPPTPEPLAPAAEVTPALPTKDAANHSAEAAASATRESWQRAARGLREHDFGTADDALLKLAAQGTDAEREAAQLVRAQLLLSQGRSDEARALLQHLSRDAHSAANRAKAEALLARAAESSTSHRSFELGGGTKQP